MGEREEEEHQQQLLLVGDDNVQQQKQQQQQYDDVLENNNNNNSEEEEENSDGDDDEDEESSSLDIQIEQKRRELDLLQHKHQQDKQSQSDEIRQHQHELDDANKTLENKLKDVKSSIQKITLLMKVAARGQGSGLGYGGNSIMMLVQDCLKEHYHKTTLNQSSSLQTPMYVINKEVALISALLINFKVLDNQIRIIQYINEDNIVPYLQKEKNNISNELDKSISQSLEKLSKIAKQNTECYDEYQLQLDAIEWERIATLKLLTSPTDDAIIKDKDNTGEAHDDSSTVPLSDEDDTERSGWDEIVATSSHWLSSLPWAAAGGGGGDDDEDENSDTSNNNNNSINETSFHCDFAEEEEEEGVPSTTKNDDNDSSNSSSNNPNHFAAFLNSSIDNIQKFTTTVVTAKKTTTTISSMTETATATGGGGVGWLVGQQQQQQQQPQQSR